MLDPHPLPESAHDALIHLPSELDDFYEVVGGKIVEQSRMGAFEVWIASFLNTQIDGFARRSGLGRGVTEMLFRLSTTLARRPDVAYVSYQRWPRQRRVPRTSAWNVIPDLAVEIVSQTNTFDEIVGKVREYMGAGVTRVWIVLPTEQRVYVYHSPTDIQVFATGMQLGDALLLPGFAVSLDDLFDVNASDEG